MAAAIWDENVKIYEASCIEKIKEQQLEAWNLTV